MAQWSLKTRKGVRYMGRSPSESSVWVVPVCGMQVPPLQASEKAATARSGETWVKVAVGGLVEKLGDIVYMRKLESVSKVEKNPGVPSGGGVGPSRSEGRKL